MAILISIDGVPMPTPSTFNILTQDLHADSTTRTEAGVAIINRVRAEVYKLECEWSVITEAELKVIKDAVRPVTTTVVFEDSDGTVKTRVFYTGDKKSVPRKLFDNDRRWDYSFNMVEV